MSLTNFRPLEDRVLIEPSQSETKTASGIIVPDTAREKPQEGKVVAIGPGKKDEAMIIQTGDHVLFGKHAGTEISFEGKSYLIMRTSDVYGITNRKPMPELPMFE